MEEAVTESIIRQANQEFDQNNNKTTEKLL